MKSKGIGTQFELAGEFELSEFELPRLYCNEKIKLLLLQYNTDCTHVSKCLLQFLLQHSSSPEHSSSNVRQPPGAASSRNRRLYILAKVNLSVLLKEGRELTSESLMNKKIEVSDTGRTPFQLNSINEPVK